MNEFYKTIQGWFDYADIYDKMVERAKDGSHFVEVGSHHGRSACYMATAIKNSGKKIRFDAVDIFRDNEIYGKSSLGIFEWNMKQGGVEGFVNPVQGDSVSVSKRYADKSLDFVWIDADHSVDGVLADLRAWHPKVKDDGCFAGHDYAPLIPGVIRAVNIYFAGKDTLELIDYHYAFSPVSASSWATR